jgi:GH25 family lysozyme M1 (1,4-beta-N-acetylmuramidase)
MTTNIPGADFCHWQALVNVEKLLTNNIKFAIVKAGEVYIHKFLKPCVKDELHDRNISELKRVGIICGDYYYFHPSAGASKQARHYAEIYSKNPPDLPPIVDCEDTDGLPPKEVGRQLLAFINEVAVRIGRNPIVYSRNGFLVNQAGNPDWPMGTLFWIARYAQTIGDLSPKIKPNVIIWQYTDKLKLPGLPAMDGNYWLRSMDELLALANNPAPVIVPEPEPASPKLKAGDIGIVTASVLNVRTGGGTEFKILGQLYKDNEIKAIRIVNNRWVEFQYKKYPSAFAAFEGEQGMYIKPK